MDQSVPHQHSFTTLVRGACVVAAAAVVGGAAVAATLVLTALALLAGSLWAAATLLWRLAAPQRGGRAARAPRRELHLEGRRTPHGWTVEAVQR